MASVINAQPGTVPEDDGGYQTPRSPSFNDRLAVRRVTQRARKIGDRYYAGV